MQPIEKLADTLEIMIDKHGFPMVLEALALACSQKSDRLCKAGFDAYAERTWDRNAAIVLNALIKVREGTD